MFIDCMKIASGIKHSCVLFLLISWNVSMLYQVKRATNLGERKEIPKVEFFENTIIFYVK